MSHCGTCGGVNDHCICGGRYQNGVRISLYDNFMEHDSLIGPRPIRNNALDAQYVGRALQSLREDTADAIQCCMTPTGFNPEIWKSNELRWARETINKIIAETFREDVQL